ncbi:hypothetical protein [Hyphococcus sp.]|nr:MAG: hypothetical protein DHS20C04_04990 [Marinicaulis sp.]
MSVGVFEMFSLVEWIIFGFIGANVTLASLCVLQRGVKKLEAPARD